MSTVLLEIRIRQTLCELLAELQFVSMHFEVTLRATLDLAWHTRALPVEAERSSR